MKVLFHKSFEKDYTKLSSKEQARFKERLVVFMKDQFDPILSNHPLLGKYKGYRSISIGGDIRAIYKLLKTDNVIFVAIGTHSKLYS